jgi:hypothetical protein
MDTINRAVKIAASTNRSPCSGFPTKHTLHLARSLPMSKNPFLRPTDDRERRQPPLSPHFGKEYTGNTYTADDQNNLRRSGFSRIEAENLAQFFDSHAATLFVRTMRVYI